MSELLQVQNLTVKFDTLTALRDISFDLEEGETLAVIGPNGSGKTVLLKTLLGLLPYEGQIHWTTKKKIGYIPQKIEADRHLPITLTNLLYAKTRILGLPKSAIKETIKIVGLNHETMKTPVGHLSGGQFQKGLVALAILGQPEVILLDEPTASLDQPSEEHIYDLLHRLQDTYSLTLILVSHDLSVVYRYATKVLCLNRERLCYGLPQEVLTPENLRELYGQPHQFFHHLHPSPRHD